MKLYNTLTRSSAPLEPAQADVITMYSCGPTVYDQVHIGNLGSFIFADTLRRTLAATGSNVTHVMNFTDVDDKTIGRSRERYPELEPLEALLKLTGEYSDQFLNDMVAVGNNPSAMQFVKATDSIESIQQLIRELVTADIGYITDDGIYFSIEAYQKSGKTYGQLTEITAGSTSEARIDNDEYDKESIHDFALWKVRKEGEPSWEFTIDGHDLAGRPGWHIECSAMSSGQLGVPFDIHTGGVDLIFPHHENEIAQSTAARTDATYAKVFAHNEHMLIDGKKMSKSLGNFYTLQTLRDKGFDPLALRLLVLQAHYRSQAHFSWDNLQAAQNRLKDLRSMAALRWQPRKVAHDSGTFALRDVPGQLAEIMADDLNSPQALAHLSRVSTQLLTVHIEEDMVDHFEAMLSGIDQLFGLNLSSVSDITAEQKALIASRETARAAKDWAASDALRDQLVAEGIGLEDHQHGVIWFPL